MPTNSMTITSQLPDGYDYCGDVLLSTLRQHEGVVSAEIDGKARQLRLRYDAERVSPASIDRVAQEAGTRLESQLARCNLLVEDADCQACAQALRMQLAAAGTAPNVTIAETPSTFGIAQTLDLPAERIAQWVRSLKPDFGRPEEAAEAGSEGRLMALLTGIALIFLAGGWLAERFGMPASVSVGLFAVSYLAGGYFGTVEGLQALRERTLDVNILMVVAALGAASIGEWVEGGMLLFLFSLSGTLEEYAMGRTQSAIRSLMGLRPDEATILRSGEEIQIAVESLRLGDLVIVRPGERIPADGTVTEGNSAVDQSPITGESMPVEKRAGTQVYAGTINGSGALTVRVTKLAEESTLSKIIQLVAEAQSERAPTQRFIDDFGDKYAFGVIAGAILMIALPPLVLGWTFDAAFYRAMTLLVVASPCALVISTPASILSAIANAARNGVLFKGGAHLENAAGVEVVAFDKTGTLTTGRPRVTDVIPLNGTVDGDGASEELLALAASVEQRSEHPLAQAIVAAAEDRNLTLEPASDLQAFPGQGVQARLNGQVVRIGNRQLFQAENVWSDGIAETVAELETAGKTVMLVGTRDGDDDAPWTTQGLIAVADTVRPAAPEVVLALRERGVKRIVMLTGDNRRVAEAIGKQLGLDEVHAELLPEEKVEVVRRLQAEHAGVAVVGDGVNDAPALANASIGIAMGAAGTDVALETADVVLMADDLAKLPYAVALGWQARRVVKQNVIFAVGVIVVLIAATLLHGVPLPLGVVGHEGSTLLVVTNGLRLLGFRHT